MVAWEGGDLVFIEVKCRRGTKFGSPQESITPRRFQHLQQAIDRYLSDQQLEPDSYRVDVMAIEVGRGGEVIRHQLLRGVEAPVW